MSSDPVTTPLGSALSTEPLSTEQLIGDPRAALDAVRAQGQVAVVHGGRVVATARVLADGEDFDGLTAVQPLTALERAPEQVVALLLGDYKFRKTVGVSVRPDYRVELRPTPLV